MFFYIETNWNKQNQALRFVKIWIFIPFSFSKFTNSHQFQLELAFITTKNKIWKIPISQNVISII